MSEPAGVELTPLRDEDSDALFDWINDRELVQRSAPFEPVARADHDRWFGSIRERDDVEIFAIRFRDGRLVGSCQLNRIDRRNRACELQIRIGEAGAQGRGHGTEALRLLLAHAFGPLGMERVGLEVFATNEAAIRAYEKVGFRREGVLRSAALIDGDRVDLIAMGVLRTEFEGGGGV
ncbi:MAG: GNAT family N-acetyltransferase [Solirubrobacterales bacterium]